MQVHSYSVTKRAQMKMLTSSLPQPREVHSYPTMKQGPSYLRCAPKIENSYLTFYTLQRGKSIPTKVSWASP